MAFLFPSDPLPTFFLNHESNWSRSNSDSKFTVIDETDGGRNHPFIIFTAEKPRAKILTFDNTGANVQVQWLFCAFHYIYSNDSRHDYFPRTSQYSSAEDPSASMLRGIENCAKAMRCGRNGLLEEVEEGIMQRGYTCLRKLSYLLSAHAERIWNVPYIYLTSHRHLSGWARNIVDGIVDPI